MNPDQLRIAADKAAIFIQESYLEWQTSPFYTVADGDRLHVTILSSVNPNDQDYFKSARNPEIFKVMAMESMRIAVLQPGQIKWATIQSERGLFLTLMDWTKMPSAQTSSACVARIPDEVIDFLLPLSKKHRFHIDLTNAEIYQQEPWRIWRDRLIHAVKLDEAVKLAPFVRSVTGERQWHLHTNMPELRHWWTHAAPTSMNENAIQNTLPDTHLFSNTRMGLKITGNGDLSHFAISNHTNNHFYAFLIPRELREGLIEWGQIEKIYSASDNELRLRRRFYHSDMQLIRKKPPAKSPRSSAHEIERFFEQMIKDSLAIDLDAPDLTTNIGQRFYVIEREKHEEIAAKNIQRKELMTPEQNRQEESQLPNLYKYRGRSIWMAGVNDVGACVYIDGNIFVKYFPAQLHESAVTYGRGADIFHYPDVHIVEKKNKSNN